jgi:multidrug efflux pump subunit AcrA (membrane-fusion protein)
MFFNSKAGFVSTKALLGLAGAGMLSLAWWITGDEVKDSLAIKPLLQQVSLAEFVLEVTEPGEVESAENVEIRCEVRGRSSLGVSILEIVPEGTIVQKGDFLVRLDDASLQKDLLQQRISVHQSRASLVKSKADLEAAQLSMEEYLSGSFRQEEEQLESSEFVGIENLRRAEEYFSYSKRLASKGYVSDAQLEADQFAVEKARKELDLAQTKLEVLRVHSKKAKVNDLTASIQTLAAKLKSVENSYELECTREKEINEQIKKCIIKSPASGEVTYANRSNSGSEDGILIAEGKLVRERQKIIRLPDASLMRVIAKVNENRIEQIREGMICSIKIDALRGIELIGRVESVSDYPLPSVSRYTSHIKEYATHILIHNPPIGIRSGMSAKVSILSEKIDQALQVPITAIFRRNGNDYCLVSIADNNSFSVRALELGSNNLTMVVVLKGLKEGENILVNPDSFIEKFASEIGEKKTAV